MKMSLENELACRTPRRMIFKTFSILIPNYCVINLYHDELVSFSKVMLGQATKPERRATG